MVEQTRFYVWSFDEDVTPFCYYSFCVKLLGSPDDTSLGFLRSDNARRYMKQFPQCRKQQFAARFPNMSPGALDLLEKMLVFDPHKRITGKTRSQNISNAQHHQSQIKIL